MNYRHAYHAGNFADVLKHGLLCWTVHYLQRKPGPLCLIDTHAGTGFYDLTGTEAGKTGEAREGIVRLLERTDTPTQLEPYLGQVAAANKNRLPPARYPGSPALMAALARQGDRVVACELHPEEAAALTQSLDAARARVVSGDGYRTLLSLVPPGEKRGLVVIDPPFEVADEFERLARAFVAAHRKWPTGVYMLWFPIKDQGDVDRFKAELSNAGIAKLTLVALDVARAEGLSATGLILCNAPYTLEEEWRATLTWLATALAQGPGAWSSIERLSE